VAADFVLTSTAFLNGRPIPPRYTCDGENLSPPLFWTDPPRGTKELALTVEDADEPTPEGDAVHWLGWGLSPSLRELPEGVEPPFEGRNTFGHARYDGPCDPPGPHHYVFRLHALMEPVDLPPASRIAELREVVAVQVIAVAELVGIYGSAPGA
jgi:Raf kinase inhibitor-like YbhB/YbcL family protein